MAVEIKEMVIRVELEPDAPPGEAGHQAPIQLSSETLIEECVARVMAILSKKKER